MPPQTALAEPKSRRPSTPLRTGAPIADATPARRADLPGGMAPPASAFAPPRPTAEQNGVEVWGNGLPTTPWKSQHRHGYASNLFHTARLFVMACAFPLWPIFVSMTVGDWSFTRHYFKTLFFLLKQSMPRVSGHSSFFRMFKYNVFMRPKTLEAQLAKRQGSCTRCAKCCKALECIFLGWDAENSVPFCRVYNTRAWYFGTCSRYPIDQADIDDHGCPGFSFPEDDDAAVTQKASFAV